jgi:uncharacterized protein (TIGR00255 family)
MISSMTAYARSENVKDNVKIYIEARSYNSRHLDIVLKMPADFSCFEEMIKKKIASVLTRGRVEIRINLEDSNESEADYIIDYDKASSYYEMYKKLVNELDLKEDVPFEQILKSDGVMKKKEKKDSSKYLSLINESLDSVLEELRQMRDVEGETLYSDFSERLDYISSLLSEIESETSGLVNEYKEKLFARIQELLPEDAGLDQARLAQEAAIIADKSDVSEEIVRINSHLNQFRDYMDSGMPAGRKLNFLLQELHREINTLGVKSGSFTISKNTVEIKAELEKLREQVQNVE